MTTKAAYRKMKRCCIYKLEFPAPGDRVGSDSSDINALYLHVQPALLEIQLSACVPSFPNKDFLMEIFSPNPSKNCKSPKPWSRMQLNAGPCREAAAEGTHGLLPLCSKAPPQEEPPSLSSALSHISENFLISRAQPKAQQADWVNVFPGSEHCCCSAQNHTLIRPEVLSDTLRMNPESQSGLERILQLLSFGHLPPSQESLSSLNLDTSRDEASPKHVWVCNHSFLVLEL